MPYVDGFVLAAPRNKVEQYKEMARLGGEVWMEHGALSYVECIGDDVPYGELTSFPRAVQAKDDEVVVFSWITYESRAKRDEVNAKSHGRPADEPIRSEQYAVRRQTHDLRRLRKLPRTLVRERARTLRCAPLRLRLPLVA